MDWLRKNTGHRSASSGLEWEVFRNLPHIAVAGTVLLLIGLALLHLLAEPHLEAAQVRRLQIFDYMIGGLIVFHWFMVGTVAIGCSIVMIMKGPAYTADGYRLSHSDRPRATIEADEEAARHRMTQDDAPPR
jgi:hypothetical protein